MAATSGIRKRRSHGPLAGGGPKASDITRDPSTGSESGAGGSPEEAPKTLTLAAPETEPTRQEVFESEARGGEGGSGWRRGKLAWCLRKVAAAEEMDVGRGWFCGSLEIPHWDVACERDRWAQLYCGRSPSPRVGEVVGGTCGEGRRMALLGVLGVRTQ